MVKRWVLPDISRPVSWPMFLRGPGGDRNAKVLTPGLRLTLRLDTFLAERLSNVSQEMKLLGNFLHLPAGSVAGRDRH